MARIRFAFVLLFSFFAFEFGAAIPALPHDKCDDANAEFVECGSACVPTCAHPEPAQMCTYQCVVGCFCKSGFLKNAKGECVRPQECEARQHPVPVQFPGQSPPQCPDNEEFHPCGTACPATCANPHPSPVCTRNCVIGCFCNEGFLRNARGLCVETRACEAAQVQPQSFAMLRAEADPQCGENEEYRKCKGCDGTCQNPNPPCPRICKPGCACKEGHLRSDQGKCIETRQCTAQPQSFVMLQARADPQCGENEEYRKCKGCDGTCQNPNPPCPRICKPGCACKEGHLRSDQGKCIATRECSAQPQSFVMLQARADPQCGENEEYRQCKGCDGTCQNPNPLCPRICKPGCACKEGHLRSDQGKCIETRQCSAQRAQPAQASLQQILQSQCGRNEIFLSCGTACPATCADPQPSSVCTKNCVIGCFCQEGFLKNARGVCVEAANCNAQ